MSARVDTLRRRVRWMTGIMIAGLILAGLTAIPLVWELDLLAGWLGGTGDPAAARSEGMKLWIGKVREALHSVDAEHHFLFYGTDWLAFGHVVIAVAFVGAWRDPVRNRWLFRFGMIASVLVIPWALAFGALRGIPFSWRLIDCLFAVGGFIPMWLAWRWTGEMEDAAGLGQCNGPRMDTDQHG